MLTPTEMLRLDDGSLFMLLGEAVRDEHLGALPEEEESEMQDATVGKSFFNRQLDNIKRIYCKNALASRLSDEEKQDVDLFVAALLDSFIGYYGGWAGTIILVQIYKIGIQNFCGDYN